MEKDVKTLNAYMTGECTKLGLLGLTVVVRTLGDPSCSPATRDARYAFAARVNDAVDDWLRHFAGEDGVFVPFAKIGTGSVLAVFDGAVVGVFPNTLSGMREAEGRVRAFREASKLRAQDAARVAEPKTVTDPNAHAARLPGGPAAVLRMFAERLRGMGGAEIADALTELADALDEGTEARS